MKNLLLLALLLSCAAAWATAPDAPLNVRSGVLAQTPKSGGGAKSSDDDDEDEAPPVKSPTPAPVKPVAKPAPAAAAPSDAPVAPATPAPGAAPAPIEVNNPSAQRLVNGAPLFDPNVAVHSVEKKQFSDRGRSEVVLYPAAPQINGKFTQHYGTALSYVYHLHENFGFQITPQYNWYSSESDFNQELINKVREQAQAATSLLLVWGIQGGVEVTPLYGKFTFYEGTLGHFSVVLNAGAGIGETRMQLRAANSAGPASFGDAGSKFLGSVGGGFRVLLGDRFALRLEVRDMVYTARVDAVDGCNSADLGLLDTWFRNQNGTNIQTVQGLRGGCDVTHFAGVDIKSGYNYASDIPLALNLVQSPSSDVLNNVGFYAGLSFLF